MTFVFDRFKVFGWIIHRKKLVAGDEYIVQTFEDVKRDEADNMSIWTKGRVSITHLDTNEPKEDRLPGMFSLDRPAIVKGRYSMRAEEDSEFWCINHTINRRKLPELRAFVLNEGESQFLPKDTLLLVCTGTAVIAGNEFGDLSTITFSGRRKVTAKTRVIGLIFGSENV